MTDDLTLHMDAYLPLRDVVFNTLREAILKGDLKPGERLMELQLADKLGGSRTPIREAIRMLEQEGLAVTMPRKGAEVAKMTLKDMEDALEIREALDELAGRIAWENPKLVALLKNLREQIYRYRVEYIKDPKNYPVLIAEHQAIVEGLKNRDKHAATLAMEEHVKNQAVAVKDVIQRQE